MFSREQIGWIISDIFRTELVKQRQDTFAFFDAPAALNLEQIPPSVQVAATCQVGLFFGFRPGAFLNLPDLAEQAYRAYQKNKFVQLSTSGSTGIPKQCLYPEEMMQIEAAGVGKHFKYAKRFITLTPRQHLYGLSFAVFFSSLFKIPCQSLAPIPLQPWFSLLRAGDVVAGFPLFWEYFLKAGNTFPNGVTAVTSTGPCPKGLFDRLKQAGADQVIELYGASETGGIGVRYSEEEPFQINDFWEISADHSKIRRKGLDGWLPFPDQVQFVPPRSIFPLKRTDRVVQVAGVNVSLKHVEDILQQHPAVKACRVRLMRQDEGKRLKAFIVLNPGYDEQSLADIRANLSQELSSHELPRAFTFGKSLPVNEMGKDSDW